MPSQKDMRAKISSVKSTQQITQAMKMVSSAKLKRAQDSILNLRPYSRHLLSLIADIASTQRLNHPLLEFKSTLEKSKKHILIFVISSDRGLCGAFNSNVNRFAEKYYIENKEDYTSMNHFLIGKKAFEYFKLHDLPFIKSMFNLSREISFQLALKIARSLMESYVQGQYDEIRFVYNSFKSMMVQDLKVESILPVDLSQASLLLQKETKFSKDLLFEPKPEQIVDDLLEKHFATQVYRCMSESVAAEHAARRVAMENATKNAEEMLSHLKLKYNKLRQASITKELIEITSGAESI